MSQLEGLIFHRHDLSAYEPHANPREGISAWGIVENLGGGWILVRGLRLKGKNPFSIEYTNQREIYPLEKIFEEGHIYPDVEIDATDLEIWREIRIHLRGGR